VLADLPGLIEGAHEGVGLGDKFLGHAERCGAILHLVDGTADNVARNYKTIRAELKAYGHGLAEKHEILALNKADAFSAAELEKKKKALEKASGGNVHLLSGVAGRGVKDVLRALVRAIARHREELEEQKETARKVKPVSRRATPVKRGVVKPVRPKAGFGDNIKGTAKKPKAGPKAKAKKKQKR
jgi:GTP-binding protein